MKRPTIADIARRAGVTKAAVSFALNGQPGVSAATRERILAIADEIGFEPSKAARALSDGRAGAFGLIIGPPARYDNDLMALSGLGVAQRIGVGVPAELSIVAWDDSPLCEFVHPPLTALSQDSAATGAHAARTLIRAAAGGAAGNHKEAVPRLTVRGSTSAPAPVITG